jgi:hypothetical protein
MQNGWIELAGIAVFLLLFGLGIWLAPHLPAWLKPEAGTESGGGGDSGGGDGGGGGGD